MVSVTGSVTWISHSPSVIGMNPDPRRRRDEIARYRYRPERGTEAVRQPAQRRKAGPLPSLVRQSRAESHDLPTGVEKGTDASEAGAYLAELRVGSGFSMLGFSADQDNLRVKRKGILGQFGRFSERLYNLSTTSALSQRILNVSLLPIDTSISKPR